MSVFSETLERIAGRVEGVRGLALIGRDGIILESFGSASEPQLEPVAAEITGILKNLMTEEADIDDFGDIQQFSIESGSSILILVAVASEYYLLVLLSRDGNFGRARFEARKAAAFLEKELV